MRGRHRRADRVSRAHRRRRRREARELDRAARGIPALDGTVAYSPVRTARRTLLHRHLDDPVPAGTVRESLAKAFALGGVEAGRTVGGTPLDDSEKCALRGSPFTAAKQRERVGERFVELERRLCPFSARPELEDADRRALAHEQELTERAIVEPG